MPSTRTTHPEAPSIGEILEQSKVHQPRVNTACRGVQKLGSDDDNEAEAIVQRVLEELTVHDALEEGLLYPAARAVIADESLLDQAEVEHEAAHRFIEQLRGVAPVDDRYAARFTVLCGYVLHQVKEEEGRMFAQLENARLNWVQMAPRLQQRRAAPRGAGPGQDGEDEDADPVGTGRQPPGNTWRSRAQPA